MFIIVLVLILIFLSLNFLFYTSIKKTFPDKKNETAEQKISIVVAAKNEEKNIPSLIDALNNQNYNQDKFLELY